MSRLPKMVKPRRLRHPAPPNQFSNATDSDPGLTVNERVGHYVEMWKKTVDVQQHFNDIEWRIRGLALTTATFAVGAAGVAAKDNSKIWFLSLGGLVLMLGLASGTPSILWIDTGITPSFAQRWKKTARRSKKMRLSVSCRELA